MLGLVNVYNIYIKTQHSKVSKPFLFLCFPFSLTFSPSFLFFFFFRPSGWKDLQEQEEEAEKETEAASRASGKANAGD